MKYDIYVISADGGLARQLTPGPWQNVRPSWSQDGKWIYFSSRRGGERQIWKIPAQGGAAVPVRNTNGGFEAFESLDGQFVYYAKSEAPGIWRVPVDGGETTKIMDRVEPNQWAITSTGIYFFDFRLDGAAIGYYSFSSAKTTLVKNFSKGTNIHKGGTAITATADGSSILYTQLDQVGTNLVLVENFN